MDAERQMTLGQALDALNAELNEVEDWLVAEGYHVRAAVLLPGGGSIAWGKVDGRWSLLWIAPDAVETRLTANSVARRLEAVDALPSLLVELQAKQSTMVPTVLSAIRRLWALRGVA